MGLTKAKIAERIYSETYFTTREAESLLESLLEVMKESLCDGEPIKLQGFGSFTIQSKKSRKGRNPSTGKSMIIPPRKAIKFKPANALKEDISIPICLPYRQKRPRKHIHTSPQGDIQSSESFYQPIIPRGGIVT